MDLNTLANDPRNPFNAAIEIFKMSAKIKNVLINDFFDCDLTLLSLDDFLQLVQRKYPAESSEIFDFVKSFESYTRHKFSKQVPSIIENLRRFVEPLMRQSEILARISSRNSSSNMEKKGIVISKLMECSHWIEDYYNAVKGNYHDDFSPLAENFFEQTRLDPFDMALCKISIPQNFNRNITIGFDTAQNCFNMYSNRLNYIDQQKAAKIKADIQYILDMIKPNDFDYTIANIATQYISNAKDYIEAANDYRPFLKRNNGYYTNATLLSRYIEHYISDECEKSRRYLIKTGFDFEKRMKKEIDSLKYLDTNIKRTQTHREFDVVIQNRQTKDIINIQCKNFSINLYKYKKDPAFAARRLSRVMTRLQNALKKEISREKELIQELNKRGIRYNNIKHWVVSKHQIPSNDTIMDYEHFLRKIQ